jgi:hypothetical protein
MYEGFLQVILQQEQSQADIALAVTPILMERRLRVALTLAEYEVRHDWKKATRATKLQHFILKYKQTG